VSHQSEAGNANSLSFFKPGFWDRRLLTLVIWALA